MRKNIKESSETTDKLRTSSLKREPTRNFENTHGTLKDIVINLSKGTVE